MANSIKNDIRSATAALLKPARCKKSRATAAKAVTTLVTGLVGAQAAASQNPGEWEIRTATLVYAEADRVSLIEPVVQGTRYFNNDRSLTAKIVLDALTGASANGAVPSDQAQTFTRPSGDGTYNISANETPLDDTFHDTRVALSANWSQPLLSQLSGTFGVNVSKEFDYLSIGANTLLNYDFNRKNSSMTLGLSFSSDTIDPVGGTPIPGSAMQSPDRPFNLSSFVLKDGDGGKGNGSSESKSIVDMLLGYTQVLDRKSLMQVNYSLSQSSGYMTDPYKLVSVVDPDSGQPLRQLYENRPDSRSKQAIYTHYLRNMRKNDVLDVSYRYLWDDWGLTSHTMDMRYRISFGNQFIEPHLRYYQQDAVDFHVPFLLDGAPVPTDMSADYRVGDLTGTTVGLEYGRQLKGGSEWRVALEYYLQSSQEPDNKPGQLAQQEVYPDVDAVMLRFNFDFDW